MQSRPVLFAILALLLAIAVGGTIYLAMKIAADIERAGNDAPKPPVQASPAPVPAKPAPPVAKAEPGPPRPSQDRPADPRRPATGQPEWRQKLDAGLAAYRDKRPDDAIAHYAHAIGIAERSGRRPVMGVVLSNTGSLYWSMRKLDLAEIHLLRAVEITDSLSESEIVAELGSLESMLAERTQRALALVYRDQGRNAEAITHFRKALAATRELKAARADTIGLANAGNLYDIAVLQCKGGNKDAAARSVAEARKWIPQQASVEHRLKAYARLEENMAGGRGC